MNLIRYNPNNGIRSLQDEINQFFHSGDWFPRLADESNVATSNWMPAVDIKDEDDKFVISADIPGVDPKDIEVNMEDGVLTIKGERRSEEKEEGKGFRRVECSYGSFYRRFSLPDSADSDNIKAKGKDGVLEITVAKRAPKKAKKIPIKT